MNRSKLQSLALVALLAIGGVSQAAILFQQLPMVELGGVQSDGSTTAYSQEFAVAPGSTLDRIVWWGFNGANTDNTNGVPPDAFVVTIGGAMTGSLTVVTTGGLTEYTLDVPDGPITSGSLSIANIEPLIEWFWQSSPAAGVAGNRGGDGPTAFRLEGTVSQVPEPTTGVLFAAAAAALAWVSRRRL